jgi:hypothetical protein
MQNHVYAGFQQMEGCTGWKLMDIEHGMELIDYPYSQLKE